MKKNTIVLDIDDTILNWRSHFLEWMELSRNIDVNHDAVDIDSWSLHKALNMEDDDTIEQYVYEFNSSDSFRSLSFKPKSIENVNILKERYNIIAITCCGNIPKIVNSRDINIAGLIPKIHYLPLGSLKTKVLESYSSHVLAVVDDAHHHLDSVLELDYNAIHYNENNIKKYEHSFSDWDDVHEILEKLEKEQS